ncbi:hypothetical protein HW132_07195 [Brasilonema sp. CT11]|nr:hypothetical protein [Brasilonema sp. CT11]
MLLNKQQLFFKANSLSTKEVKSSALVEEQITNNYLNSSTDSFKKSRLSAKWEIENGKLVCKWLIY